MRTAVIVYSLTGNTRRVAEAVAARMGAEVSAIVAPGVRPGFLSIFRWGMATLLRLPTPVSLTGPGATGSDVAILAAPVWAGRIAVPMRCWLAQNPVLPTRLGLILTGGAPAQSSLPFDDFAKAARAVPVAKLYISAKAAAGTIDPALIEAFCADLLRQS